MAATIGSLNVSLGIDSAQFNAGLRRAQDGLERFGKISGVALASVAAGAAAASAALAVAVKGAIDHADEMGKAAQKAGVTVEALSRLEYAAKLSDVSLEGLTGGLGRLSKAMAEVAGGAKGGPATAFAALGISVKDAQGNLRTADEVFRDVADRFGRMEDGATKTSVAMQIFGKSGADLIPLLNSGADGLAAMAAKSDAVGYTLNGRTTAGAEAFNDSLTGIGLTLQGVTNTVMTETIGSLNSLSATLSDPRFAEAAVAVANILVNAFNAVAGSVNAVVDGIKWVMAQEPQRTAVGNMSDTLSAGGYSQLVGDMRDNSALAHALSSPGDTPSHIKQQNYYEGFNFGAGGKMQVAAQGVTPFTPLETGLGGVDKALEASRKNMADWAESMDASANAAADAMARAAERTAEAWSGTAGLVGDALSTLATTVGDKTKESFELSKKLSMASSIVAGIEATMQAFKKGNEIGGLPLGVLWGGIAAATAAAKVAAIGATTFDSTSMAGGAAAGGGVATPGAAAGGQAQGISISLAPGRYSAQEVASLIGDINSALKLNGKQLSISTINGA